MNTRAVAARVIIRVRDEGAYSNVLLPHATADLSRQDRAFVYSLVTGLLRRIRLVDSIIEAVSSRSIDGLDPEVRALLEVAVAEMLTDTRDTAYATVNETVEAVKQLGSPKAAPFVNAVLRRLGRDGIPDLPPDAARDLSVPDWLLARVEADYGAEEAAVLLAGLRQSSPPTSLRLRPGGQPPLGSVMVEGIGDAYYASSPPAEDTGVAFADAASTAVGLALAPRPGERVLDMAAAPGGKTLHLWDQADGALDLVAMDVHRRRLRSARRRLDRLGVTPRWVRADGAHAPFAPGSFDAVLLDAPCTGLGTLRRRPEIAMRLEPGSVTRSAAQQQRMLEEAWRLVRPGGRIVYSVCTVFAAETEEVIAEYPARPPAGLPGITRGRGLLLAPHLTGTDAMYIAVIDR